MRKSSVRKVSKLSAAFSLIIFIVGVFLAYNAANSINYEYIVRGNYQYSAGRTIGDDNLQAVDSDTILWDANDETYGNYVNSVYKLINEQRRAAGVSEVTLNSTVSEMALIRATENAENNWFVMENGKHIRPDGRSAITVMSDMDIGGYFGEIMGRRFDTPEEIVNGWVNSSPHYACMTNPVYEKVGIGIATSDKGELYWVAVFYAAD